MAGAISGAIERRQHRSGLQPPDTLAIAPEHPSGAPTAERRTGRSAMPRARVVPCNPENDYVQVGIVCRHYPARVQSVIDGVRKASCCISFQVFQLHDAHFHSGCGLRGRWRSAPRHASEANASTAKYLFISSSCLCFTDQENHNVRVGGLFPDYDLAVNQRRLNRGLGDTPSVKLPVNHVLRRSHGFRHFRAELWAEPAGSDCYKQRVQGCRTCSL